MQVVKVRASRVACLRVWLVLLLVAGAFETSPSAVAADDATASAQPLPRLVGSNGGPQLLFTDLASGPSSGNSDSTVGSGGAIVTVWGRGLGSSQGTSTITVGGVLAPVYVWRNADGPAANMYAKHGMQMISFLVPATVPAGAQQIQATVGGVATNTLPFTVRAAGNIYYVKTTGSDSNNGSWGTPWRTIRKAVDTIANGDIIYVADGVTATTSHEFGACVNLNRSATAALPRALVAYPDATVNVGGTGATCSYPFENWDSTLGAGGGHASHWVVSKMRALGVGGDGGGINVNTGFRVVGNYIRIPQPHNNCQSGMIYAVGSDFSILGNQITDTAKDNPSTISKLCHTIYITGQRSDSRYGDTCGGVRCPTESNRDIGWNLLNDNYNNRGINLYSEQDRSAFLEGHKVHDNYVINHRGDGILIGYYVTGENWFYNNVLIETGLGPNWNGGTEPSGHNAIQINGGHESGRSTTLYVWNNTIYGGGFGPQPLLSWFKFGGKPGIAVGLDFANNIVVSPTVSYWRADSSLESTLNRSAPNLWFGQGAKPAWNTGGIAGDPMFANTTIGDLHLTAGSPAIDVGRTNPIGADFDGLARPRGTAFDLGAFEFPSPKERGDLPERSGGPQ